MLSGRIADTACIDPSAQLDETVEVGPYTVIGPDVKIEAGTKIANNVTIVGNTVIGKDNLIYSNAVVGTPPQDLKHRGEVTYLRIGDCNTIREFVTINTGTVPGGGETVLGDHNTIMACCHVAHDCILGNRVVMANNALLGGHVVVQDDATFGGMTAVHHFVTIGEKSFVGGMTRVAQDVPPFTLMEGNPARVRCVNTVGLRRKGMTGEEVDIIRAAFRVLYRSNMTRESAFEEIKRKRLESSGVMRLIQFLRDSDMGKQGRARERFRQM